jgi:transposase
MPDRTATWKAIVRAHQQGLTYLQIAQVLDVGVASVSRTLRRYRETGGVAPKPPGGGWRSPLRGKGEELIHRAVKADADVTLAELVAALGAAGIKTSIPAVGRMMRRLGYTRKKRHSPHPSGTGQTSWLAAPNSARR